MTVGGQVHGAITRLMRWSSRSHIWNEVTGGRRLSPTDVFLLGAIIDGGPVRVTDLAAWQGVDKSTVTPQVQRLAAAGLVDRSPDPADGRATLLLATDEGRALQTDIGRGGARVIDELTAGWPEEDRRELGRLLDKLVSELGPPPARDSGTG